MGQIKTAALFVCLLGVAVPAAVVAKEPAKPATPTNVIRFEKNVLKAYEKGVKEQKPIVVIFLCPLDEEKCVHCKRERAEIFSQKFAELKDRAVFVIAIVPRNRKGPAADEVAVSLFTKLGRKSTPAISVLEPNSKKVVELGGTNGYFNAKALVKHVGQAIDRYAPVVETAQN